MRGADRSSGSLFSYVDLESRVPAEHPLRVIREIVNEVLVLLHHEFLLSIRPCAVPGAAWAALERSGQQDGYGSSHRRD